MNINFKKLTMGLITALLFTACGNNETENTKTDNNEEVAQESTTEEKGTLYFIPIVDTGAYWSPMRKGAEETAEKLGYDLVVKTSPPTEAQKNEKHIGFLNEALSNGAKGVAIAPMEANIFLNPIKQAMDSGTPVITFDADLENPEDRTAYVGTDNVEAGKRLGIEAAKVMKEKGIEEGTIAIVNVDNAQPTMILRTKGVKEGFEEEIGDKASNYKWLEPIMDKDQAAESKRQLESAIVANPDLKLVFSLGSEGPDVGVMEALQSQNKAGEILHFGFDWTPTWLQGIEDGRINAIVDQDAYTIGVQVIENLVKAVEGEEIDKTIPIDVNYVKADGLEAYGQEKDKQMSDTVTE